MANTHPPRTKKDCSTLAFVFGLLLLFFKDCYVKIKKKKRNFFPLFSELKLEGHGRDRLAKVTWVLSSKGTAPEGGEPSVAVPMEGGSWLG